MRKRYCESSSKGISQIDRRSRSFINDRAIDLPRQFKIASGNRVRETVVLYNGFRDLLNTPHVLVDSRTMDWLQKKSGSVTTALSSSQTANSIIMAYKAAQKVIANTIVLQSNLVNRILEQVGLLVKDFLSPFLKLAVSDFESAISESIAE